LPSSDRDHHAPPRSAPRALSITLGLIGVILAMVFFTSPPMTGGGSAFASLLFVAIVDSLWALAWVVSAVGFGWFIHEFVRRSEEPFDCFSIASGVALLFWLDHLLGWLGLMQRGGAAGAYALAALGIAGFVGWAVQLHRAERPSDHDLHANNVISKRHRVSGWGVALALITASMYVVPAASAPGYLWESEFGGFDALSYHLQLPREWLALERIALLEHNVYSFLPSYVESAYYHLAVMRDPLKDPHADGAQAAALSCQYLHAMLTFLAFGCIAQLLREWTARGESDDELNTGGHSRRLALELLTLAGLALPWVIVVGTLAYNEMPTILFGAAALWRIVRALHVSHNHPAARIRRSDLLLIGLLLGCACGAKLTALGFVVIPVMCVFSIARWRTPGAALQHFMIALGGFLALAPYALRNLIETDFGNPFFPFAGSIFGRAHWTAEQVARWSEGHLPDVGGFGARMARLWEMAFAHPQWTGWWFVALAAGLAALALKATRRRALLAWLMLVVQLGFWLFFTHLQSRFLLPCTLTLMLICALPLDRMARSESGMLRRAAPAIAGFLFLITGAFSMVNWITQRNGNPAALVDGMMVYSGAGLERGEAVLYAQHNPTVWINVEFPVRRLEAVYLLGDSTPFYLDPPYVYHTTWDASPLGAAIRARGDDPNAWASYLRDEFNVRYILVNWSELTRLIEKDDWYDPDVTIEHVRALRASDSARLVKSWPDQQSGRTVQEFLEIR